MRGRRRNQTNLSATLDAALRRALSAEANPVEWSGPLACLSLLLAVVTGFALFAVYRISGNPYRVVAALDSHLGGRFLRTAHRYGADAALLFSTLHALREVLAGHYRRRWMLPWGSGFLAVGILLFLGLTGYLLPWDRVAQLTLQTLTEALDRLPLLAAPPSRLLVPGNVKPWLFYLSLATHAMFTTVLTGVLAAHVLSSRRRRLWPRARLGVIVLGLILLLSLLRPVGREGPAELTSLPAKITLDLFYLFWLPLSDRLGPEAAAALVLLVPLVLLFLPLAVGRKVGDQGDGPGGRTR